MIKKIIMIFDWLKKQKEKTKKIQILKTMIVSLQIPEDQKTMYVEALEVVDEQNLDGLYTQISFFVEKIELKEVEEIRKTNFLMISGMKKSEAEEKKKELNSFSFLVANI